LKEIPKNNHNFKEIYSTVKVFIVQIVGITPTIKLYAYNKHIYKSKNIIDSININFNFK